MPWLAEIYEPWSDMSLQTAETEGDGPWPFLDVAELQVELSHPFGVHATIQPSERCLELHVSRLFPGVSCLVYFPLVKRIMQSCLFYIFSLKKKKKLFFYIDLAFSANFLLSRGVKVRNREAAWWCCGVLVL